MPTPSPAFVEDYELVLVDCPPGQETLPQAALAADRGLLAYELEEAALAAPKWYERLRGAAAGQPAGGGENPRSRSATGLAEDFQALGEEIIARIAAHEATDEAAQTESTTAAGSTR